MQYNLYKPNSKGTGCAFSFKIITKDKEGNPSKPTFLIQSIKQAGWDAQKRTGSFSANAKDPEKNIYCKINENEAGAILDAIEKYSDFSAFHTYNDDKTTISLKPYTKNNGVNAWSFGVIKNSTLKFGIGIEIGEARTLKSLLELYLIKFFTFEG
tara:strand:- start:773 stop:1237 length:465 start_codon:yes stop_codon:yes gene_type:complete